MYVFFTKQTIVKSIKVLVLFQNAEETCKICKMDFNDERNKITLAERGSARITYASVQRGEDLEAKTGDHVDVSAPTRVSLLSVKENYHRVTIKEKTIAKMFVLWPSGGDAEEGYQEEIVWTIDVDKHKDSFRGWFLNTYCKTLHGLEM